MYISEFLCGVVATITIEVVAIVIAAFRMRAKGKRGGANAQNKNASG